MSISDKEALKRAMTAYPRLGALSLRTLRLASREARKRVETSEQEGWSYNSQLDALGTANTIDSEIRRRERTVS